MSSDNSKDFRDQLGPITSRAIKLLWNKSAPEWEMQRALSIVREMDPAVACPDKSRQSAYRRTVVVVASLVCLAACVLIVSMVIRPTTGMAAIITSIRQHSAYRFEFLAVESPLEVSTVTWQTPGSLRYDLREQGELVMTHVLPHGKDGLMINHRGRSMRRVASRTLERDMFNGDPARLFMTLVENPPKSVKSIDDRMIDGAVTEGFEMPLSVLAPDAIHSGQTVRLWVDQETHLPVLVEITFADSGEFHTVRLTNFTWNPSVDDKFFTTTAPKEYSEQEPIAEAESMEQMILDSFKIYSEWYDRFPQTQGIPVVRLRDEMSVDRLGHVWNKTPRELITHEDYHKIGDAMRGFGRVQHLLDHQYDAAYFGLTVTPGSSGNVLFRWRKDDNSYRVLFGDLTYRTLSANELSEIERRR